MTNKTGLFDVDFSLSTKELTTQGGYAMLRNLSAFDKMWFLTFNKPLYF